MKRVLSAMIFAAMLFGATAVQAKGDKGNSFVRTEWGLVAGLMYPWSKIEADTPDIKVTNKLGYTAGLHIGICFGKMFAIQPELLYSYTNYTARIDNELSPFTTNVKSHTLQLPVMLSVRLSSLRFHAGPVLTLVDNPMYIDQTGSKQPFGRIYPTLGYTAGIGTRLLHILLIDLRYYGTFNSKMHHALSPNELYTREFKSTIHNVQLKVGIVF